MTTIPLDANGGATPELSVIVPAHQERARIASTLEAIAGYLGSQDVRWELIVVDDGSTDGTGAVVADVARTHEAIRLVRLDANQGKGAALRTGVLVSRGRRVLLCDADLSTPIEEIESLSRALDAGASVVIGSRAVAASRVRRPQSWMRRLFGRLGNAWIQLFATPGLRDTQCGFKLLDGRLAREIFAMSRERRFAIDVEILWLAQRRFGARVAEVGVRWEHVDGLKVRWRDYLDALRAVPAFCFASTLRGLPERVA